MKKKIAGILVCILLIIIAVPVSGTTIIEKTFSSSIFGKTLFVGGSGPDNYTYIQDAIDDANDGDTVFVYSGIYYETIYLNKQIDLIGEDRQTTIIDGERPWGGAWNIVLINSDYATVSGFSILHGNLSKGAGISSSASYIIIHDNIISNNYQGIELYGAFHITISENIIANNADDGIYMFKTSDNIIIGNVITTNYEEGIYLRDSQDNIISDNTIRDNLGCGIRSSNSSSISIYSNDIIKNKYGIHSVQNSTITGNVLSHNKYDGVYLSRDSWNNIFTDNRIACNDREGIQIRQGVRNNHIYHNLFLSHYWNAFGDGAYWYNNTLKEGNYWHDYIKEQGGYDDDGDGIGDIPYHITGGGYDHYPLMEPWGDNEPPETPIIDGPTSGNAEMEYEYTFLTTDPEGECIQYYIHWGDKKEFWLGPFNSGDTVTMTHAWARTGTFTIKAKARDFYGLETDWATLDITMPKSKDTSNLFLFQFLVRIIDQFPLLAHVLNFVK
jgi:parallel beta-helix repeat protein